jgi:hypothetical protein
MSEHIPTTRGQCFHIKIVEPQPWKPAFISIQHCNLHHNLFHITQFWPWEVDSSNTYYTSPFTPISKGLFRKESHGIEWLRCWHCALIVKQLYNPWHSIELIKHTTFSSAFQQLKLIVKWISISVRHQTLLFCIICYNPRCTYLHRTYLHMLQQVNTIPVDQLALNWVNRYLTMMHRVVGHM